jgi:hypothetical protein
MSPFTLLNCFPPVQHYNSHLELEIIIPLIIHYHLTLKYDLVLGSIYIFEIQLCILILMNLSLDRYSIKSGGDPDARAHEFKREGGKRETEIATKW